MFDDGSGSVTATAIRDMLADNLLARVDDARIEADASDAESEWARTGSRLELEVASPASRVAVTSGDEPSRARGGVVGSALAVPPRWFTRASRPAPGGFAASVASANEAAAAVSAHSKATREQSVASHWRVPASAGADQVQPTADSTAVAGRTRVPASGLAGEVARRGLHRGAHGRRASQPDRLGLGAVSSPASAAPLSPSSPWASGVLRSSSESPVRESSPEPLSFEGLAPEWADALAALLQDEADLRGVE